MIKARCIEKIRSRRNIITSYILMDVNGRKEEIETNHLKAMIKAGSIQVTNLKLTRDNRLIDSPEESRNQTKGNSNQNDYKARTEVAKAIIFLNRELAAYGDSFREEVEIIAMDAGVEVDFYDEDTQYEVEVRYSKDEEENYLYNMYLKSMRILLEKNTQQILRTYLNYYQENIEQLRYKTIDHEVTTKELLDITKNPIARALCIIDKYTKILVSKSKVDADYSTVSGLIYKNIVGIDINGCKVGQDISNKLEKNLDDRYFTRVIHNCFSVGKAPFTEQHMGRLGAYTTHVKLDEANGFEKNTGYQVVFNKLPNKIYEITAEIYEYRIDENYTYYNKSTGISIKLDKTKDLWGQAARIATALNNLASEKFKQLKQSW